MSPTMPRRRGFAARFAVALGALAIGAATVACSSNDDVAETSPVTTGSGEWPRTVETADGPVTLETQPERIVSTSVTLTGSLLALDAPLVGTGAQPPPSSGATPPPQSRACSGSGRRWPPNGTSRRSTRRDQRRAHHRGGSRPHHRLRQRRRFDEGQLRRAVPDRTHPRLRLHRQVVAGDHHAAGRRHRRRGPRHRTDHRVRHEGRRARAAIAPALAESDEANILTYNSPQDSRIFTAVSAQGQLAERLGS